MGTKFHAALLQLRALLQIFCVVRPTQLPSLHRAASVTVHRVPALMLPHVSRCMGDSLCVSLGGDKRAQLLNTHLYSAFSAPCSPTVISKHYTCSTSSAVFRWSDAAGGIGFLAQLASDGYQNSCQTTNTSCAFQNLPCGLDLNMTVVAQGAQCNSTQGAIEVLQTGNM